MIKKGLVEEEIIEEKVNGVIYYFRRLTERGRELTYPCDFCYFYRNGYCSCGKFYNPRYPKDKGSTFANFCMEIESDCKAKDVRVFPILNI